MEGIEDLPNVALLEYPEYVLSTHMVLPCHILIPQFPVFLIQSSLYFLKYTLVIHTLRPFFGQDTSSARNSNTCSPIHLCLNLEKSH